MDKLCSLVPKQIMQKGMQDMLAIGLSPPSTEEPSINETLQVKTLG